MPPRTSLDAHRSSRAHRNDYVPEGTNTEIWRVLNIGEGSFWRTVRLFLLLLAAFFSGARRSIAIVCGGSQADGPDWISFAGEIAIKPDVKIGGFKAGGLWVKVPSFLPSFLPSRRPPAFSNTDIELPSIRLTHASLSIIPPSPPQDCVVLSITPPDAIKGPIGDLRHVVPVRIVTDPWSTDGAVSRDSPTGSEEFMLDQPALEYHAQ